MAGEARAVPPPALELEVAELVGEALGRHVTAREIIRCASEGPDGFYVRMQC
jgi:hypothetical protein